VLEILTAILAAVVATKLQGYITWLEGAPTNMDPSDPYILGITLLVCNCAAEVVLITLHMFYGCVRGPARHAPPP
jgi:hypothetical protein